MLQTTNQWNHFEELQKRSDGLLHIDSEVYQGLKEEKPIVAFETVTALCHGASTYPENAELILEMCRVTRDLGAVPALIAIDQGVMKVGLSDTELNRVAEQKSELIKVSKRDIPLALGTGRSGATTTSGAIVIAAMAGIRIIASAGIGGVHIGAQNTFDISSDLQEVANHDVALICAGSKSIIDIKLTLEYLETFGIPVLGYKTRKFPSLCVNYSDSEVDKMVSSHEEIADVINKKWKLDIKGGVLVVNPIDEEYSIEKAEMDSQIDKALSDMKKTGIKGSECTTYLLDRVNELTSGDSQLSIQKLLISNAELSSKISIRYSELNN